MKREHGRLPPIRGRPRDCERRADASRHWTFIVSGKGASAIRCEPGDLPCVMDPERPPEGRSRSVHDRPTDFRSPANLIIRWRGLTAMNAHSGPSAATTLLVCVTCKSEAGLMGP